MRQSPFSTIAAAMKAKQTPSDLRIGRGDGGTLREEVADLRSDLTTLADSLGQHFMGRGTRAPFGLCRAASGTSISASAVSTPGMKNAYLCAHVSTSGYISAISVGNRPYPLGASSLLDVLSIDPTAGNSDAGFPLGDIETNEPVTVTGTLDTTGTSCVWLESR